MQLDGEDEEEKKEGENEESKEDDENMLMNIAEQMYESASTSEEVEEGLQRGLACGRGRVVVIAWWL